VYSKATIQPFATKKIMAVDSKEEETGSQGTRQSTRNEGSNGSYKRGAYRNNRTDKSSLQGNIAELGNDVYQYGTGDQGGRFTRTTEAIADYVGREYGKEMRLLVKNQKENEPKEAVMPDEEEAKLPFVMKKYKTDLKQYYFKKERYEEHKAKIFTIVKGQCTLNMKNKVESLQGYSIEANDDVIKLLLCCLICWWTNATINSTKIKLDLTNATKDSTKKQQNFRNVPKHLMSKKEL
jgi:hypothetical protein